MRLFVVLFKVAKSGSKRRTITAIYADVDRFDFLRMLLFDIMMLLKCIECCDEIDIESYTATTTITQFNSFCSSTRRSQSFCILNFVVDAFFFLIWIPDIIIINTVGDVVDGNWCSKWRRFARSNCDQSLFDKQWPCACN